MATLYWGGGTGTWGAFITTNWYTDVGRTTLSTRAPSAEDDVVFDSASNATAYTVTIFDNTTVCRNITIAGPASGNLTLAGTNILNIYGSLTLPATGFTRTFSSAIVFYGTGSHTITTNGVVLASNISFSGGGTYTLQDALNNSTSAISVNSGVFNTDGKNLTCGNITASTGVTAGTLILGASTVSATAIGPSAPLTINAGTSNITISSSANIGGGINYTGNTFNNVTFSSTTIGLSNFYGNNTFNNLTFAAKSSTGASNIVLHANQTVTGTLTISGQLSVRRYFFRSNTIGTSRTLTVGTVAALTDVDFRDITVSGVSAPWSGTRLGDCGGNTGVTFPAAKTVYWNGVSGGAWSGNFWATSSGGAVSAANFPLAQDTAIIDDTGLNTGSSISGSGGFNLKTLTSTKTNAYTLVGDNLILYGDLTLTPSIDVNAFGVVFSGRVTQNFTSAGNVIIVTTIRGYNSSVKLADNTTFGFVDFYSGGLDTDNKSLTISGVLGIGTGDYGNFELNLGSSSVFIGGSLGTSATDAPTMTVNAGTSTITLTSSNASIGFEGQTLTWYNVTRSTALTGGSIFGVNTFNNLTLTAPTANSVNFLTVSGNQTVNGTLALGGGTSVTQRLGVASNVVGTQRTISAAAVTGLIDIDFRDINANGAANWTTGTRLGDCGNNTGITFPVAKTVYWNLAGAQNWSATAWAIGSGGTPAANNFPLAQDTAVFDNTGSVGTVTMQLFSVGTLNASGRTVAMTLAGSGAPTIYGDVTYGSGVTPSNTGQYTFSGRTTQTHTTSGKSVANAININKPSGTFQHGDAYTSTAAITVTSGTYTTQNYNISCSSFNSSNSNIRSIIFGTSTVTASAASPLNFATSTNLTFSGASSTVNLSSGGNKTFQGGNQTFGTVSPTVGVSNFTITGSNTFGTLTNSVFMNLVFTSGTTQTITNFTYSGASGNVVRWSASLAGQRASIKQSVTGGSLAAVGANSIDGGNNLGLTFTGLSPNYLYVKDISYVSLGGGNFFMLF
jgi:hypothetical protein